MNDGTMKSYKEFLSEAPIDSKKKKASKLVKDLQNTLVEIQRESSMQSTASDIGKIIPQLSDINEVIKKLN